MKTIKNRILSILLSVIMLLGMLAVTALPAFAETGEEEYRKVYNTLYGQTLGEWDTVTYYYVDSDTSCTAEEAGISGLKIADNSEVHIVVAAGVTLYCKGGDASGGIGGGAGIEVPLRTALYLEGNGTVIATGGAGEDGEDGTQGEKGYYDAYFDIFRLGTAYDYYGGDGGRGGNGGGGAGAGVGTVGGAGGKGGAGGRGDGGEGAENHMKITAGERGLNGISAAPMGAVYTSPTVKLKATGGACGEGGNSVILNSPENKRYYQYRYTVVPGCTGGGGQGGGAGASVGTGGRGGGGGTGGNGSPAIYQEGESFDVKMYSGYGGGNTDGNYVEGSNMGHGGEEVIFAKNKYNILLKDDYPYGERKFGGSGGTVGKEHVHVFDEDDYCIVCGSPVLLIEDGVLTEYNGFGGTVVIPEGVTGIANDVFNGSKKVTDVVFPSTLEEIGSSAFNGSGLTSVSFPSSVKTIGHNAFQNCASLTSVEFPAKGEITILNSAFQGTELKSIDIPVSVKAIGDNAFKECASLKNVIVHWTEEDEIVTPQGDTFAGIASNCELSVPQNTTELYKNNEVWGRFSLISDTMPYMAYDFESETFVQKTSPIAPVQLTSSEGSVALPGGWYAAGNATIDGSLTFEDDAYIIFENGETLTVNGGIVVGTELTFYAQTTSLDNMGEVFVPGTAGDGIPGIECTDRAVNVHGGKIEVTGGKYAAGIGGRSDKDGGNVTVYGGYVKASTRADGAGIGGGRGGVGKKFTIYGGKVDAYGSYSSGIGGGRASAGGIITINGGEVSSGNNIGGGYEYHGLDGKPTKVIINGGKVNVYGDNSNIGGSNSTVEINGGDIKIAQGTLGVARYGRNADITVRGGNIDSYCFYYTAIGGTEASNVNVKVYGGSIKAQSKHSDAVDATSFTLYPDAEKCELFTVKDFSGNELTDSPVTEQKDITSTIFGKQQVQIDLDYAHTGMSDCICDKCGYVEKAAKALFDSKAEAKLALSQAAGENQSAEMQAIVKEAEKKIDEAESAEEIEKAVWEGLAEIEAQKEAEKPDELITPEVCRKCGKVHADNFFGQIVCFFNRIINWFKKLF